MGGAQGEDGADGGYPDGIREPSQHCAHAQGAGLMSTRLGVRYAFVPCVWNTGTKGV